MSKPRKVIIDTDPGIDDALALFIALASPQELEVVGITIGHGNNSDIDLLSRNACYILQICNRLDILVIKGACESLVKRPKSNKIAIRIHGDNGLGNVHIDNPSALPLQNQYNDPPSKDWVTSNGAAQFIIDSCKKFPGEITIITLASLTNLAVALQACSDLSLHSIVSMAGAIDVRGNRTPMAEANVAGDPEAARIVFQSPFPKTLVPLDITTQFIIDEHLHLHFKQFGFIGNFLYESFSHYKNILNNLSSGCYLHDPIAILVFLRGDLFESKLVYVDVECVGELTTGKTVADWRNQWKKSPNLSVIVSCPHLCFVYDLLFSKIELLYNSKQV